MTHPYELTPKQLKSRMEEMVSVTFGDIQSQFLVLPKGPSFIEYAEFQVAYEVLKRHTKAFAAFTAPMIWSALREDALALVVLRTILGLSPPEWAEIAQSELDEECGFEISQGAVRGIDTSVRQNKKLFENTDPKKDLTGQRVNALIEVAIKYIQRGAPAGAEDTVHRLAKMDTSDGLVSVRNAATLHVPYAILLYERYLGRPFASHRDSVSSMVGDVMESAIEEQLTRLHISFRKTRHAERIAGFEQAPDFFVPDEFTPKVIFEAKIAGDDGTARDKVSRILRLAKMRDDRTRARKPSFEVVACVDGRGFGVRRQDMRDMLLATKGKVFTLSTLDQLVKYTSLRDYLPQGMTP